MIKKIDNPSRKSIIDRYIFCTQFNLGFGNPRLDVCAKCDAAKQPDKVHLALAQKAQEEMKFNRAKAKQPNGPMVMERVWLSLSIYNYVFIFNSLSKQLKIAILYRWAKVSNEWQRQKNSLSSFSAVENRTDEAKAVARNASGRNKT